MEFEKRYRGDVSLFFGRANMTGLKRAKDGFF
jgi:hypothetical protein